MIEVLADPFTVDSDGRVDVSEIATGANLLPAGSIVTLSEAAWSVIRTGDDVINSTQTVLHLATAAARQHFGRSLCEFATAYPRRRFRLRLGRTVAGHLALHIALPCEVPA